MQDGTVEEYSVKYGDFGVGESGSQLLNSDKELHDFSYVYQSFFGHVLTAVVLESNS